MAATQSHVKIKLREVNRHLVCRLCRGYYVDATTIAECLHSFCRSCIIKYLDKNSFCPICEVQIHRTKPYLSLRLDKALQDVVYKVVPGLYHDEMKRRREFYSKRQEQIPFATPEQCGVEERIIFSPEDSISLSLEYLESDDFESETVSSKSSESGDNPEGLSLPQQLGLIKLKNGEGKTSRRESQDLQDLPPYPKRYLQCPAVVNVGHLKKFLKIKHELTDKAQVNVIHKRVPLPDHYTLMDVAYIYTWKRSAPLRFFYQIFRTRRHKLPMDPFPEAKDSKPEGITRKVESEKCELENNVGVSEVVKCSSEGEKRVKNSCEEGEVVGEGGKVAEGAVGGGVEEEQREGRRKAEEVGGEEGRSGEAEEGGGSVGEEGRKEVGGGEGAGEGSEDRRLLLNPISGQLESVPSSEPVKEGEEGGGGEGEEGEECFKREVMGKGGRKSEGQGAKDLKKSGVNLLKNFRKEKGSKEDKMEIKSSRGSSLTITAVTKIEKPAEKKPAKFTVEIKAENKESEYDFDGSSSPGKIVPLQEFSKHSKHSRYMSDHRDKWLSKESKEPKNNWMSLQDFRAKMFKENNSSETDSAKKSRKKLVPSLYKINSEKTKTAIRKTPNGKLAMDKWKNSKVPRTLITIDTETENKKAEIKMQVLRGDSESPPKPITIANRDGEFSVKQDSSGKKETGGSRAEEEKRQEDDGRKPDTNATNGNGNVLIALKSDSNASNGDKSSGLTKETSKSISREMSDGERPKSDSSRSEPKKPEVAGAIDLSKSETSPRGENPLESLMDMARKGAPGKADEKVMEALVMAAQKQSIEPLLKIPQYSQMLKNSLSQGSHSPAKNISSNEISQALQFLEELKSDIKVFETKNQLNPNLVLEQFAQKSAHLQPYQELYQQKIDLIRRLKRHQQNLPTESESPARKLLKLSPPNDSKKKLSPTEQKPKTSAPEDPNHYKASIEKTLSQIQLLEFQSRMLAAQNYKNLPNFLRYYNRSPACCPGPTSPNNSSPHHKPKSSSHSPNSSKSPPGLSPPSANPPTAPDTPFFNPHNYLLTPGLNSEMTYHQMFQSYLTQQEQLNQAKLPQINKKPIKFNEVSAKSLSEKYYVPQPTAKKQEPNNSDQKT